MKAILTDNGTKAVLATLDVDNSNMNASNGGTVNFASIALHLTGTQDAPIPSPTATYDLQIEDDAGVLIKDYPSVTFQNYSRMASEQNGAIVVQQNLINFKIN